MRGKTRQGNHLRVVTADERQAEHQQEKEQVIAHLKQVDVQIRDLKMHYEQLMRSAVRYQVAASELARALGKTEGAVRMYRKRKGIER